MKILDVAGFEWDNGNMAKCQKYGVPPSEIEIEVFPDLDHSQNELRYIAIGSTLTGRNLFVCFTLRRHSGQAYIALSAHATCIKRRSIIMKKTAVTPYNR